MAVNHPSVHVGTVHLKKATSGKWVEIGYTNASDLRATFGVEAEVLDIWRLKHDLEQAKADSKGLYQHLRREEHTSSAYRQQRDQKADRVHALEQKVKELTSENDAHKGEILQQDRKLHDLHASHMRGLQGWGDYAAAEGRSATQLRSRVRALASEYERGEHTWSTGKGLRIGRRIREALL